MGSLISNFSIETTEVNENDIRDYDIFRDKDLLDELRNGIISSLIDEDIKSLSLNSTSLRFKIISRSEFKL